MKPNNDVLRTVDEDARRLARMLVRAARFAALASLMPDGATPLCSRVLVSSHVSGEPILLVSALAPHAGALAAHPRCSILFGEPGTGDPLAFPRISVFGEAIPVSDDGHEEARTRFLARHPSAAVYCDFTDFRFLRIAVSDANLNGGFAKAYTLMRTDIVDPIPSPELVRRLSHAATHMNVDHSDALDAMAFARDRTAGSGWRIVSTDVFGFEMAKESRLIRLEFGRPVTLADEIRPAFVELANSIQFASPIA